MTGDVKPKTREGLLATDHSKRGRRLVSILDPDSRQVTLLEPWEHAVLVLCDGQRTAAEIVDLLAPSVEDQEIDAEVVHRCLKFFERESLIQHAGLRHSDQPPPGPTTMAELQRAYAEWHREPPKTGEHVGLAPPYPRTGVRAPVGLEPTVAVPKRGAADPAQVGTTLVLAGVSSVGGTPAGRPTPWDAGRSREEVMDLLAAVDDAVAEAGAIDAREKLGRQLPRARAVETSEVMVHESRPVAEGPEITEERPKIQISADLLPPKEPSRARSMYRPAVDAVLAPTMVGPPPPAPPREPVTAPANPPGGPRLADLLSGDITETATLLPPVASTDPSKQKKNASPPGSDATQRLEVGAPETDEPTQHGKMVDPQRGS
ncbi:MAG: hypothetical protein IT384_19075 [Deltaproteobacteria bacterium]|nr:hypothetical protein [Deltaproteobacteria bacterium]